MSGIHQNSNKIVTKEVLTAGHPTKNHIPYVVREAFQSKKQGNFGVLNKIKNPNPTRGGGISTFDQVQSFPAFSIGKFP